MCKGNITNSFPEQLEIVITCMEEMAQKLSARTKYYNVLIL